MSDRIFLVSDDDTLKPMDAAPYAKEDVLQRLLERYPDLLAGEQVDPEDPRRWLLIKREAGIEHRGDDAHAWRLDHLFLDQDGVPTLVETKIAENPELRRKVVGQMLDYAANICEAWSVERIRTEFESTCEQADRPSDDTLREHLTSEDADGDLIDDEAIERFWMSVKTNLEAGRLRLVFVADHIPSSLLRIVEFLNGQMDPCEVLAIELRQYLHQSEDGQPPIRTLVPRVHGVTATVRQRKKSTRMVEDPGIYILEPIVGMIKDEFDMATYRRMYKRGWLRCQSSDGDKGWLLYQNRKGGYICIYYDGYRGDGDDARFDAIVANMEAAALPGNARFSSSWSEKRDSRYARIQIDGFDYADDSNWDELRSIYMQCLGIMIPIVEHADA